MSANIAEAAILGALGGLIGGIVGAFLVMALRRFKPEWARHSNLVLLGSSVISAVVVVNAGVMKPIARLIAPSSPLQQFGETMSDMPEVKARIDGKSAEEVQRISQALTVAGLPKVEDRLLVTRARLFHKFLVQADEAECAALMQGRVSGPTLVKRLEALPAADRDAWLEVMRTAVEVEVGRRPAVKAAVADGPAVAEGLAALLPEGSAPRFLANLEKLPTLGAAEACWTARSLYGAIQQASEPLKSQAARLVVMP